MTSEGYLYKLERFAYGKSLNVCNESVYYFSYPYGLISTVLSLY